MILSRKWWAGVAVVVGLVFSATAIALYAFNGFSQWVPLLLFLGCVKLTAAGFLASDSERLQPRRLKTAVGRSKGAKPIKDVKAAARGAAAVVALRRASAKLPKPFTRGDWIAAGIILVVFAPLYMINAHGFPRQMNTDEIVIMNTARAFSTQTDVDIFEPSYYSDLPTFIFWGMGKIAQHTSGEVTLTSMRTLHAASGVLIIALCFLFLRMLGLRRSAAVAGAAVIGLNHSFFIFARMGMRDNTAVLFEVLALLLLFYGYRIRNYGWTLLGGITLGIGLYTYYPTRITTVIWLGFIAVTLLTTRFVEWKRLLKLTAVALAGALIMAAPLVIATSKHTRSDPYPDQQFLWTQGGRDQEKLFRGTETTVEAIRINILHGLATYNVPYTDQGLLYNHPGYGFSDKFTGIFLWMGVVLVLMQLLYRRTLSDGDRLALIGFFGCYLSLAFLLTRAPDYTRVMITLPFVGYFIGRLVEVLGMFIAQLRLRMRKLRGKRPSEAFAWGPWLAAGMVVLIVASANVGIVRNYYQLGEAGGDGVGDTLRFQEKHQAEGAQWLFAYDPSFNYFYWGIPTYWQFWLNFVPGESRPVKMVTAAELAELPTDMVAPGGTGYMLTTGEFWNQIRPTFESKFKVVNVEPLDPQSNRVAVRYTGL